RRSQEDMRNVNDLSRERGTASRAASIGKDLPSLEESLDAFMYVGRVAEAGAPTEMVSFALEQPCMIRVTKACRRFDQGIEHGLQVEVRATDHSERVRCRCLLLKRFAQLCLFLLELGDVGNCADKS